MARFVVLLLAAVVCVSAKSLKGKSPLFYLASYNISILNASSQEGIVVFYDNRKGLTKSGAKYSV